MCGKVSFTPNHSIATEQHTSVWIYEWSGEQTGNWVWCVWLESKCSTCEHRFRCQCNLNQVSWPEKEIRSKAGLNLCKPGMLRHALICFKVITYIHDRQWQWNSSSWCLAPPKILCHIFPMTLSWVIQMNYWVYLTVLTWFWLMTSSQIQTC